LRTARSSSGHLAAGRSSICADGGPSSSMAPSPPPRSCQILRKLVGNGYWRCVHQSVRLSDCLSALVSVANLDLFPFSASCACCGCSRADGKFYHSDRLSAATCGFRLAPLLVAVCPHNRAWICKWSIFRTLGAAATDQTNWANTGFFFVDRLVDLHGSPFYYFVKHTDFY